MKFSETEYEMRLQIFADTHDLIETHNSDPLTTYRLGHNQFSHLTIEEFAKEQLSMVSPKKKTNQIHKFVGTSPTAWDWSGTGAVTPVKDQGKCRFVICLMFCLSCLRSTGGWSFSVAGGIEGAYYVFTGTNATSLSTQQLISCDTSNTGCSGGYTILSLLFLFLIYLLRWMDSSFDWVKSNGGLCLDADYAWTSGTSGSDGTCSTTCTVYSEYAPTSYTDVTQGSVSHLQDAIFRQPVSIAIQANQISIKQYKSGVFTGACGQHLDHGCLAVGYGYDSSAAKDYWNVKNSWGTSWGEAGYIRIEKSDADRCGVLDLPSYPNL